jgi:hypothetical protein
MSITFRELDGAVISAIIFYWLHCMALQREGVIVPYPDDRAANRLNYTFSIYRFTMDATGRFIRRWAKLTGCFPTSIPIGEIFNVSKGEVTIAAAQEFTIPIRVTNVTYLDPIHLLAFNLLVERYAGSNIGTRSDYTNFVPDVGTNFNGTPYIDLKSGNNELLWRGPALPATDPDLTSIDSMVTALKSSMGGDATKRYTTPLSTVEDGSSTTTTTA